MITFSVEPLFLAIFREMTVVKDKNIEEIVK